jgi:hypothetical protein
MGVFALNGFFLQGIDQHINVQQSNHISLVRKTWLRLQVLTDEQHEEALQNKYNFDQPGIC